MCCTRRRGRSRPCGHRADRGELARVLTAGEDEAGVSEREKRRYLLRIEDGDDEETYAVPAPRRGLHRPLSDRILALSGKDHDGGASGMPAVLPV